MRKKTLDKDRDREFQKLTARINQGLIEVRGLYVDQKAHVEKLLATERKFRKQVSRYSRAAVIYDRFVNKIVNENGNILSARPFFREKSLTFNKSIAKSIRDKNIKDLMTYDINYNLITFIVESWKADGDLPPQIAETYEEFVKMREILIIKNTPLAISRAKIFFKKTPRSSISVLDLVNICVMGLCAGVDKYTGEYRSVWRSVCIGRMVGYMIEECSDTFLKMYPADKKILYRANQIRSRKKIEDVEELTKAVNQSFEQDKLVGKKIPKLPISEFHIRDLLNGSSYVSVYQSDDHNGDDSSYGVDFNIYDITEGKDDTEEESSYRDAMYMVKVASSVLRPVERKIIKMKGVSL